MQLVAEVAPLQGLCDVHLLKLFCGAAPIAVRTSRSHAKFVATVCESPELS
jgi:hypothetical protein